MASLCSGMMRVGVFGAPRLAPRVVPAPTVMPRQAMRAPARGALVVVAAEKKKQEPMDSAVKRAKLSVDRRQRNKSRKSAIATRIKKVVKLSETLVRTPVAADAAELQQIEKLVSEAYKEIDKAVTVGTLHKNTGNRRKARVGKYKRQALIAAGAYVPTAEQPGYSFYQRMQAKTAKAEAAQ